MKTKARVVADFGKAYLIQDLENNIYQAQTRAKKVDYACGDWVEVMVLNHDQAVIEKRLPRQSILYRADLYKAKILACNVDQVLFVVSIEPFLNENLLQRAILAVEFSNIAFMIILNKVDLRGSDAIKQNLQLYQDLGYPILNLSAIQNTDRLKHYLLNKTSLLVGQSGVGKSTIINSLLGGNITRVNAISDSLNAGRHTTTHTVMYPIDDNGFIIDSPGFQKFGLSYIPISDLIRYFPDFRRYLGQCRFHNCIHQEEPGCAIKLAVEQGLLNENRLKFMQEVIRENSRKKY